MFHSGAQRDILGAYPPSPCLAPPVPVRVLAFKTLTVNVIIGIWVHFQNM